MNYNIRLANIEDAYSLSILKKDIWETTYRGIYPDSKIDKYDYLNHMKEFINLINNNNINTYIVEYKNKVIGCMSCGNNINTFSDYTQEIILLYIKKEYQGMGLGSKLFDIAYNDIKKKGYNKFFIGCNKYNLNARKFYEKMGGIIGYEDDDRENKYFVQGKYCYNIN